MTFQQREAISPLCTCCAWCCSPFWAEILACMILGWYWEFFLSISFVVAVVGIFQHLVTCPKHILPHRREWSEPPGLQLGWFFIYLQIWHIASRLLTLKTLQYPNGGRQAVDVLLFYMFIVSSDWGKILKYSLPSPTSLLMQVSCKLSSEGMSEYCFEVRMQPAFSPLAG